MKAACSNSGNGSDAEGAGDTVVSVAADSNVVVVIGALTDTSILDGVFDTANR